MSARETGTERKIVRGSTEELKQLFMNKMLLILI